MGHTEPSGLPHGKDLWDRSRFRLAGKTFSYALDINLVLIAGVITKRPTVVVVNKQQRMVWSRLLNTDQGYRRRGIHLSLRFEGQLAQWAYDNLDQDDHVFCVGRLWHGRMYHTAQKRKVYYPWLQVERASCSMPVQLDRDPKYLRVRVDHWNAMCKQAGIDAVDLRVPEPRRHSVKYEDADPYHIDVDEVDSEAELP